MSIHKSLKRVMGLMGFCFAINVTFLLFFFYLWMKCLFLQPFSTSTGQYQSYLKKLRSNSKSCKTSVRHHTLYKEKKTQHLLLPIDPRNNQKSET